jgi:hypothetical protein
MATRKTTTKKASPAGVEQIWTAVSIQSLMTQLGKHQDDTQQNFLKACSGDATLRTASGGNFTTKQIMSKARGISKKARDAGYKCDVPRLARGGIIEPSAWGDLFKNAKLKKA